ncbi:HAD-IA family hydrolase [Tessaracoccus sp. MC1865]|uniref:HAD-IA family hydrolase n=1 Tax=Tessaracoccus sp. MC1865 TaxID=2760310 RepID=UPI001604404A|nr:HAD-IA family hydrolase [Tessaracoccus sp. MC1865]MBB1483249.1 HAD-IA family hydrolase [Tessaracoccus sp. MC1865]QTO37339.1 HAD-IA family hydrolase [Tessaracoccus sp. MC1865]
MYRHVFWDLGGTLVDTYPALDAALADVVRSHGLELLDSEVAMLTRRSTGEAIAALSGRFDLPESEFEDAEAALKTRWRSAPPPAMPGARELLRDVSAAGGLNLVVTHRDRSSAQTLLDGLGLVVDDLISTSDGHPRKPDPQLYLMLMERHGLDPADCLSVGDRPIDAEAAMAAGMTAATVESAAAPVDDAAEHSVAHLDDLRPLLGLDSRPHGA